MKWFKSKEKEEECKHDYIEIDRFVDRREDAYKSKWSTTTIWMKCSKCGERTQARFEGESIVYKYED